jgi:hypothetical protein
VLRLGRLGTGEHLERSRTQARRRPRARFWLCRCHRVRRCGAADIAAAVRVLRLGATGANLLPPVLMQRMSDDSCRLHVISDGADPQTVSFGEAREMMDAGRVARIDSGFACCMVESIRSYYFMQVQEPSVKGFLSLLENAIFPRNDLYLFELLQNAVDDEAGSVRFEAVHEDDGEGSSGPSLRIWHDGREFSPLDVFGLSSVGFSAKSGRTVRR